MRIISGKYKGTNLKGFCLDGTRPTMDRIKESMFAMIQFYLRDSVCLDLFAGSGSLGIEAISNGAKKCYFVDHSREATMVLKDNCLKLESEEYVILGKDFISALSDFKDEKIQFDIVFLDPPYHFNFIGKVLPLLLEYQLIHEETLVVCEYEGEVFSISGYQVWKEKKYGEKKVMILKKL